MLCIQGTATEWVGVARDGSQIVTTVGLNRQEGLGGFGDTIPEALRDGEPNGKGEVAASLSVGMTNDGPSPVESTSRKASA